MAQYRIFVRQTEIHYIDIEATSEAIARNSVEAALETGFIDAKELPEWDGEEGLCDFWEELRDMGALTAEVVDTPERYRV